jgi:N-acetylglucosamine-6-phosphate deacetylase
MTKTRRASLLAGTIARAGDSFDGWIRIEGDRIVQVGQGAPGRGAHRIDGVISPGLCDLQVNGGGGREVLDGPDALEVIDRMQLKHGVTNYLPTIISSEPAVAAAAVRAGQASIAEGNSPVAGIHLEGPFLNPDFRGVHRKECLRRPEEGIPDYYAGADIRLVTLAPELPGAMDLVDELTRRGIVVSIGHTGADVAALSEAASRGARCVTHLFNAMKPLHHRSPNVPGWALVKEALHVCVVPDGRHVDNLILRLVARMAPTRVILVTDASTATDAKDGEYTMAGVDIFKHNGTVEDSRGTLAGSALTLDVGVRNWMAATGQSLPAAIEAASERPARLIGLDVAIREGNRADLVIFDERGFVQSVMWRGLWTTPLA